LYLYTLSSTVLIFLGENYELRKDLNSEVALLKKEAMKKVIAGMTIGKDVSPLFAEVLKCIQTED
jgi:AP-1 complex subunit beta-1